VAERPSEAPGRKRAGSSLLLVSAIVASLGAMAGILLTASGDGGIGTFLVVCSGLGWLLAFGNIRLSRKWARRSMVHPPNTRMSPISPGSSREARDSEFGGKEHELMHKDRTGQAGRWVGGMNVPTATGRLTATLPLAVMEIHGNRLTLNIRPRWLAAIAGAGNLDAFSGDGTTLFPAKGVAGVGVGIRGPDGATSYFRTFSAADVLAAASDAGFPVLTTTGRWGV
jgi:hypothetical protein